MNDQQRAAMQMAYDLLCRPVDTIAEMYCFGMGDCDETTAALREALAQPQGEWVDLTDDEIEQIDEQGLHLMGSIELSRAVIAKFKEKNTPVQREQHEPVGYWNGKETAWFEHELCGHPAPDGCTIPLYTAPPSVEAAIEATKEKAAKLIDSLYKHDRKESGYDEGWNDALDIAEQAIRSMK